MSALATASASSGAASDVPRSGSRVEAARGALGSETASIMSPIGVIPAIGSLPNGNA